MQLPLQITFHNVDHSDAVEARIREKAEKLEKFSDSIISCRVVVESPHHHHHKGKLYCIRINMKVTGGEIVVNRNTDLDHSHEDIYVAIRDAFNEAKRQLQHRSHRRQGKVKIHEVPEHGRITHLNPAKDRGTIVTPDGRVIYFHRNSIVNREFKHLQEGQEVRFVIGRNELEGGVWASTVNVIGKHHVI